MDILYVKGELLQVHLTNNEVYEGRFCSIDDKKSKLTLHEDEGICHYYESEIRDIVKIQEPNKLSNHLNKLVKISQKKCEQLLEISKKYVYINQVDDSFYEALEELNQYSYVGVSTDGATMGRKYKMPFLVMSTPKLIYIFDTKVMGFKAFDAGLKEVLESEWPKKIIHDCRYISDCLYHQHNQIELKGVFDTQVNDLIITKYKNESVPNEVKSLQACLNSYLGLPLETVNDKLDIEECNKRPLSVQIKDTLAKNIMFLHRLSEAIDFEMKLPYRRGTECYLNSVRTSDNYKACELCAKQNQPPNEFKNVIEY